MDNEAFPSHRRFRIGNKPAAFGNTAWRTRLSPICIVPREALRKGALATLAPSAQKLKRKKKIKRLSLRWLHDSFLRTPKKKGRGCHGIEGRASSLAPAGCWRCIREWPWGQTLHGHESHDHLNRTGRRSGSVF